MTRLGRGLVAVSVALLCAASPERSRAADADPSIPPQRPPELGGGLGGALPEAPQPLQPTPPKDRAGPPGVPDSSNPLPAAPSPDGPTAGSLPDPAGGERPVFDEEEAQRCELALRGAGVDFELREALDEPPDCGAERPLALLALPGEVEVVGSSVLVRCAAALALARWVEEVVVPSAVLHLDTAVDGLLVSTTYQCRDRRGGGTPSQHAFANAVDVMGVTFADGTSMLVRERPDSAEPVRAFQAAIRGGACAYFTTVLGPATDAAHGDHLHLDLKQRPGGYRICQ